jgi:hypothetical protein
MINVDFFLVGAPKAGTTSIYSYFKKNPGIFVPQVKEPHYFSCPEVKNTYYKVNFIDSKNEYESLFEGAKNTQKTGDFSTSYLYEQQAPYRIKETCPNANIIVMLRDPVERAISHYLMDVRDGYQERPLIECIRGQKEGVKLYYKEYVEKGMYYKQIKRFKSIFEEEKIGVWLFRELKKDTREVVREMFKFVGLKANYNIENFTRKNQYKKINSETVKKVLNTRLAKNISSFIPSSIKKRAKRALISTDKPKLYEARYKLSEIYRDEVNKVQKLIKKDISHWLS